MISSNNVEEYGFDNNNAVARDKVDTITDLLVKILRPPCPQPASKQLETFTKYVQLLNSRGSDEGVNMEWIDSLVDSRKITTFLGNGMADVTEYCHGSTDSFVKISTFSQEVYPSNIACIQVWNELLECAGREFSNEVFNANSPPNLFLNEYTNNSRQCYLPRNEALVIKNFLQNEINYSVNYIQFFKLSYHNIKISGNLNEPLCFSIEEMSSQSNYCSSPGNETIIDFQAIPSSEIKAFEVDGIRFVLCAPNFSHSKNTKDDVDEFSKNLIEEGQEKMLSVPCFIPINVCGPRLVITKEQRLKKMYSLDKRLRISVLSTPSPFLSFNVSYGDKHFLHETTKGIQFDAYTNQIFQLEFDVKNLGQCPVDKLVLCTNWPEQVSASEANLSAETDPEKKDQWLTSQFVSCQSLTFANQPYPPSSEFEGTSALGLFRIIHINESNPLLVGHKTRIRIQFRASHKTDASQLFYLLFLYSGGQNCRQFRYTLRIRTVEKLFSSSLRMLNPGIGLYVLRLNNELKQHLPLYRIQVLRLSSFLCKSNDSMLKKDNKDDDFLCNLNNVRKNGWDEIFKFNGCTLTAITNELVFEGGQSISFCFFATPLKGDNEAFNIWENELFLTNQPLDCPRWNFPLFLSKENNQEGQESLEAQREMLALKILWCSTLNQAGETNTIFGESYLLSDEGEDTEMPVDEA